ncbi:unnamed protein product [Amoebophrya sp. A120]|nr:unnamed protein product [Amoebophrya sp. A120]|eukprot:GSA120T00015646001.1
MANKMDQGIVALFNREKTQYPHHSAARKSPSEWQKDIMSKVRKLDSQKINMIGPKHGSLLNLAAKHNFPELCTYLLETRAHDFYEFDARDEHGRTAVHSACAGRSNGTEVHKLNYLGEKERLVSGAALVPLLKNKHMRGLAHSKSKCSKKEGTYPLADLFAEAGHVLRRQMTQDQTAEGIRPCFGSFPWKQLAENSPFFALWTWFQNGRGPVPTPLEVAEEIFRDLCGRFNYENPRAFRYGEGKVDSVMYPLASCLLHSLDEEARRELVSKDLKQQCFHFCPGHFRIKNDILQVAYASKILLLRKWKRNNTEVSLPGEAILLVKEYLGFEKEGLVREEKRLLRLNKKKEEDRTVQEHAEFERLCSRLLDSEDDVIAKKKELVGLIFPLKHERHGGYFHPLPAPVPDRVFELARELFGDEWMTKQGDCSSWWSAPMLRVMDKEVECPSTWYVPTRPVIMDERVRKIPGVLVRSLHQLESDQNSFQKASYKEFLGSDVDAGQL